MTSYEKLFAYFKSWGIYSARRLDILNFLSVLDARAAETFDDNLTELLEIAETGKKFRKLVKFANIHKSKIELFQHQADEILDTCDKVNELSQSILKDLMEVRKTMLTVIDQLDEIIQANKLEIVIRLDIDRTDLLIKELSNITADQQARRAELESLIEIKAGATRKHKEMVRAGKVPS